jgi:hypothetical protein
VAFFIVIAGSSDMAIFSYSKYRKMAMYRLPQNTFVFIRTESAFIGYKE